MVFADNAAGQFKDCRNGQGAYAGTWTENVVSGIARDLLADAILRVEAAGYPIVLHVHDELVCEVPIGFGSVEEFTHLMTRKPAWALELPIAASAWTRAALLQMKGASTPADNRAANAVSNETYTGGTYGAVCVRLRQSKYLKAADFGEVGNEKRLKIKNVTEETGVGEREETKACVWFTTSTEACF